MKYIGMFSVLVVLCDSTSIEYYKGYFWPEARIAVLFMSEEVMSHLCKVSY